MMDDKMTKKMTSGCLSTRRWSTEKILTAVCLFQEMVIWGMHIGVMNTTMLDLELVTNSSTAQISLLWTAITMSSAIMAPIAGFLLDKVDCRLYLGLCQLGFGVCIACLPLARSFVQIMAIAATKGVFLGLLDIGRNVTALRLWGWDGAMWLQFYHFIFALGSAVSPLFTKPFLAVPLDNFENSTTYIAIDNTHNTTNTTQDVVMSESRIHVVYAIIGTLKCLGGVFCIITFLLIQKMKLKDDPEKEQAQVQTQKQDRWYVVLTVVLLFLRFAFIVGVEVTVGALQMTFLVKGLEWTKSDAVMAVFALRVAFAATRGLGVGLALFITPTKLMFIDILFLIISFVLLYISGFFPRATWIIWLSTIIMGSGTATFFSASMSWSEKYLVISGRIGGFFLLGSHCGVLAFPALAGYLFENYTPWSFVYICLSICVMLLIVTAISVILGQWYRKRHPPKPNTEPSELASLKEPDHVDT